MPTPVVLAALLVASAAGALPVRLAISIRAKKTPITELAIARTWVP